MVIKGLALHSGVSCCVQLFLEEGPVRFRRGNVLIPALVAHVTDTQRCTTLSHDGVSVGLVEHLLAALHIAGWWRNVVIEVSAAELPILDGSALPWMDAIDALGTPPAAPEALSITDDVCLRDGHSVMCVTPGSASLTAGISFTHPAIGEQQWSGTPESYAELLAARTFGFLHEVNYLRSKGLATAASLENAIVFDENAAMRPLRYPDEPVRHKALDALGDLFLLGRPLEGNLEVSRGSHRLHYDFMRKLLSHTPQRSTQS